MAGQQQGHGRRLVQPVEGGRGRVAVMGEAPAHHGGSAMPGQAVAGDRRVSRDQQTALGEEVRRAAWRMPGQRDGLRPSGYVRQPPVRVEARTPGTAGTVNLLAGEVQRGGDRGRPTQRTGRHRALPPGCGSGHRAGRRGGSRPGRRGPDVARPPCLSPVAARDTARARHGRGHSTSASTARTRPAARGTARARAWRAARHGNGHTARALRRRRTGTSTARARARCAARRGHGHERGAGAARARHGHGTPPPRPEPGRHTRRARRPRPGP